MATREMCVACGWSSCAACKQGWFNEERLEAPK